MVFIIRFNNYLTVKDIPGLLYTAMRGIQSYQNLQAGWKDASGRDDLLRILLYFDIFQYPLHRREIRQYLAEPATEEQLDGWLSGMIAEKKIFLHKEFYSVQDNPLLALRRQQGNERAGKLVEKGLKIGRFLYQFPFVSGVAISGSLSKNYADEKADIDFFIITRSNRLWLARTLMHICKKFAFLTGRQHYYCMNYYVDEQALLLDEKNIFTAIEIKTLLPVSGTKALQQFHQSNEWTASWLPGFPERIQSKPDRKNKFFKRAGEWIWNGSFGDRLDQWLYRITQKRWDKKARKGKRNMKGLQMELDTGKHYARSNPGAFREKVLQAYHDRLKQYDVV
ncbi:MAG: hypothetical protein IPP73_16935 [Chitinophagaceae bacterium]|nr:hypothetical protein [Chitinophagaceae bacterium]